MREKIRAVWFILDSFSTLELNSMVAKANPIRKEKGRERS
jgi:hypothetical protein